MGRLRKRGKKEHMGSLGKGREGEETGRDGKGVALFLECYVVLGRGRGERGRGGRVVWEGVT